MMTDEELAAVLRRYLRGLLVDGPDVVDAIERAIEVLSPCPQCGAGLIVHVCHTVGWPEVSDENENLREQYVTVCRDLIAAHQAAMDARRIADALGYALTNAESDSNGDPVGPKLDPAIAAWHQRSWRGLVSPEQAAHIREVLGPGIGDALKRTRPE